MVVLGKRKKSAATRVAAEDVEDAQQALRRHFEAQFKPLSAKLVAKAKAKAATMAEGNNDTATTTAATVRVTDDRSESESDDEWSGLSGDDDDDDDGRNQVEVVDYSQDTAGATGAMTKQERKLYLSSRPPSSFDLPDAAAAADGDANDDSRAATPDRDAREMLANDLALQRLLAESHLLTSAFSATLHNNATAAGAQLQSQRPFAAGRVRQRATDLRIQAAAAATSATSAGSSAAARTARLLPPASSVTIFAQHKMPMAQRKGMAAAAAERETRRRREARESGIVLERPASAPSSASSSKKHRARDVGAPAVGRLHGSAELRLRDRDVQAIVGGGGRGGGRGGRGGRGGKAGGHKRRR